MRHVLENIAIVIKYVEVVAVGHLEDDAGFLEANMSELFFGYQSACWFPQD